MARERTREELQEQARHVLYEIQMLSALADYIRTGEVDELVAELDYGGVPARNAIVEAFELHARNLIEFLIHQRNRHRVTAGDYTPQGWKIPEDAAELRKLRDEFSERVAHLSWKRSGRTEKEQVVASTEIFEAIAAHLHTFLDVADPMLLSDGFNQRVRFGLMRADPESFTRIAALTATTRGRRPQGGHTRGTATQGFNHPPLPD